MTTIIPVQENFGETSASPKENNIADITRSIHDTHSFNGYLIDDFQFLIQGTAEKVTFSDK